MKFITVNSSIVISMNNILSKLIKKLMLMYWTNSKHMYILLSKELWSKANVIKNSIIIFVNIIK